MRRTAEALPSPSHHPKEQLQPENQMGLTQGKEGKGTPELIKRMSSKGEEAGKAEKQISN